MITWTPSRKDYQNKLQRLDKSPDFAKDKNGVWHKDVFDPDVAKDAMDDFNAHFQQDNGGPYAPDSEIMKRTKNHPTDDASEAAYRWRAQMGSSSLDLSNHVTVTKIYTDDDEKIPISVYTPELADPNESLGAIIAFHGGGWLGGNVLVNEHFCKYMAEIARVRVFNVDYRLAPEFPAFTGVNDCYHATMWIIEHAEKLHVDLSLVAVYGDSSGANNAAVVAYMDRANGNHYITNQFMAYPCESLDPATQAKYDWPEDKYNMDSLMQQRYQKDTLFSVKGKQLLQKVYVGKEDPTDPRISPLNMSDDMMAKMPPALIATDEFDPLRPQGYGYAQRLAENGVSAHYINYKGMTHAFLDKFGIFPQGEHFAWEAAHWLHSGK